MEFIAFDWCGWNDRYGRYTHMPSGETLLCRPYFSQAEWDIAQLEWFKKFPGLNVHDCPTGPYSTNGPLKGTTDELVEQLTAKLDR
jgi:hypothetical protein